MSFIEIYLQGLLLIVSFFSIIWLISVILKNASIVDIFWGFAYVLVSVFYFFNRSVHSTRELLVLLLVIIWGIRLSAHIFYRNFRKGEDFRYRNFRKQYGEKRYWWVSFFQVFLLQGVLVWIISSPLLAIQYYSTVNELTFFDYMAIFVWLIGFLFEAGGDWQLLRFKKNPQNKGKVLQTGFWKYTRHPNYFGDATVWWAYALFAIAAGSYITVLSAVVMTLLILKVSGVSLLESTLKSAKPGYLDYVNKTPAFFPWFPKH